MITLLIIIILIIINTLLIINMKLSPIRNIDSTNYKKNRQETKQLSRKINIQNSISRWKYFKNDSLKKNTPLATHLCLRASTGKWVSSGYINSTTKLAFNGVTNNHKILKYSLQLIRLQMMHTCNDAHLRWFYFPLCVFDVIGTSFTDFH